jgi:hypothetical protein
MALLDLQALELPAPEGGGDGRGGGHGGSSFSVLLCDSYASITLCL